jgi:hypothetical protein
MRGRETTWLQYVHERTGGYMATVHERTGGYMAAVHERTESYMAAVHERLESSSPVHIDEYLSFCQAYG